METLTFLGTSGTVLTKERMCAGILYEDKLLDVGFGILANLRTSAVKLDSINEVYISHTHSDHVGDFAGLIWAMAMEQRTKTLQVICSANTGGVLKKILDLYSTPPPFVRFDIVFMRPDHIKAKSITTIHDPENLAYRFPTGLGDIVYVGDTAKHKKIAEFAKECDLLIHDATFLNGQESLATLTNHSTAKDAASIAQDAGARRLVLTHISPSNQGAQETYLTEAASQFDGEIIVAKDHQAFTV